MNILSWNLFGNTQKKKYSKNKTKKFRKMNCSPAVAGSTVDPESCYTNDALIKIKNAYNKNYPKQPITTNKPKIIFKELKENLKQCNKEDCWLRQLPESEQTYLDEFLFAPDQPSEWKNNPNEWLSNFDIIKVIHQYEQKYKHFKFIGPTPIDFDTRLPEENGKCVWEDLCDISLEKQIHHKISKIGVIFNLDEHDESGSHWVSLFIDIENNFIFYFDSAANKTPPEIKALIKKLVKQGKMLKKPIHFRRIENYPTLHQQSNSECGMYSLFFIITMLTNKTEFDSHLSIRDKIKLFKKTKISDKYVEKFRYIYFNP